MPPKVVAKNADRTGGVLPVNAAARAGANKPPAARLKLEIRRLPPALTLTEFEETLGDEWKLGNGKVDWREYRQGKVKTSGYGKIPEQSRCYVHLVNDACVKEFEKRFLEVVFHDKAGTHKSSDIKHLPPTLGFAPNQRTPLQQSKQRTDNRQGTIDQEPEFIAFLEAETQPIVKPTALEAAAAEKEAVTVKSTPLIDDLREKKANKAKAAQAKAEKTKDKKSQGSSKNATKETVVATSGQKDGAAGGKQQKVEQAAKDAAKALNKQATTKQQQTQSSNARQAASSSKSKKTTILQSPKLANASPSQPSSPVPTGPAGPTQQKGAQRPRGNTEGIKKMLQKDLGIKPKANSGADTPSSAPSAPAKADADATPAGSTGATSKPANQSSDKSKASTSQTADRKSSQATKAYLKHANPSQGITEALLQSALAQYGTVTNVTIDPRKGTAVAVFNDNESLKKALQAKRVTVADGTVEVHEFRERGGGGGGSGGGGGNSGRGGLRGGRGEKRAGKESGGGSASTKPSVASTSTASTAQGT